MRNAAVETESKRYGNAAVKATPQQHMQPA